MTHIDRTLPDAKCIDAVIFKQCDIHAVARLWAKMITKTALCTYIDEMHRLHRPCLLYSGWDLLHDIHHWHKTTDEWPSLLPVDATDNNNKMAESYHVKCEAVLLQLKGRVHTTLFRTGRDRSRPVRAQLPVSTREQPERSFWFLETTSRHGTSGRDRSRSVAPCQLCRVDARPGASARSR